MDEKEWTIMVYMAADNNLAVDMSYAVEEIKNVAGEVTECPNLFVYYDGNSPAIPTLYCDFSDHNQPKYIPSFTVVDKLFPVPAKLNENAADKRSVINFVDWCVNKVEVESENGEISYGRRSKRYALIFSGHSLGFQDIGLFRDETSGKSMKMKDLYTLLLRLVSTRNELESDAPSFPSEANSETTVLLGQKLDILGFDSCVMGMLEVGYQFAKLAKTMIASEGSMPRAGWPYAKILRCFDSENSIRSSEQICEHIVTEFIKSQGPYTIGGVSVDLAAWNLSRLGELAEAFDELSMALLDCFADEHSEIYYQMERMILHVHWKCQSYMYDQNVDLGDFCELLERECRMVSERPVAGDSNLLLKNVQKNCLRVLDELQNAVILSGFSGGEYQYSNGISVFFPWSRGGYAVSRKNYESLWFAKDAVKGKRLAWTSFLRKYLNEVALRKFEMPSSDGTSGSKPRYFSM
jgi:hypothetical protein